MAQVFLIVIFVSLKLAPQTSENFVALGIWVRERKEKSACSADFGPGSPIAALGIFPFSRNYESAQKAQTSENFGALGIWVRERKDNSACSAEFRLGSPIGALGMFSFQQNYESGKNAQTSENLRSRNLFMAL